MEFAFNGDGKATVVKLETMEGRGSSLNFTWNEQGKKKKDALCILLHYSDSFLLAYFQLHYYEFFVLFLLLCSFLTNW